MCMLSRFEMNHTDLPVGYRFNPTDEELVLHYLMRKVISGQVPAHVAHEIEASAFYSKAPQSHVSFSDGEREWYYFIHEGEDCHGQSKAIFRTVGDEVGFWKTNGEKPICNSAGNAFAFKFQLIYYAGSRSNARRTHWKMEQYRLSPELYTKQNFHVEEWVLGKLMRGMNYNSYF